MTEWSVLIAGLAIFFGIHVIGVLPVRDRLVRRIGTWPWKGVFSVIALVGFVLIVIGYRYAPFEPVLYAPPLWAEYLPVVLMPFAFILFVGSYLSDDVRRIARHPMLWGVTLWAIGHLAANGTAADLILFGSFLVFALAIQPALDAQSARRDPEAWAALARRTSMLPFAAILSGRAAPRAGDLGVGAVFYGLVAFALTLIVHAWILGVAIAPSLP